MVLGLLNTTGFFCSVLYLPSQVCIVWVFFPFHPFLPFFPHRSVIFFHPYWRFQAIWTHSCLYFLIFFPNVISSVVKKKKAYGIWILPIIMSEGWIISELNAAAVPWSRWQPGILDCIHYLWWCLGISKKGNDMQSKLTWWWFGKTEQCRE